MPDKTIPELQKECYQNAKVHGFHTEPRSPERVLMLMTSEIAEAFEEFRGGHKVDELYFREDGKPEGFGIELADLAIRLFDTSEEYGIDLQAMITVKMEYNRTRTYMHGGKKL